MCNYNWDDRSLIVNYCNNNNEDRDKKKLVENYEITIKLS